MKQAIVICWITNCMLMTDVNSKSARDGNPCPENHYRDQINGCVRCTNCTLVRLKSKTDCGPFKDADCENVCLYEDDYFDEITNQCQEPLSVRHHQAADTDTKVQSLTVSQIITTKRPKSDETVIVHQASPPSQDITLILMSIFGTIIVVLAVISVVYCIYKKRKAKSLTTELPSRKQDEPLPEIPELPSAQTKRKTPDCALPGTNLRDTRMYGGTTYTQLPVNSKETHASTGTHASTEDDHIYSELMEN